MKLPSLTTSILAVLVLAPAVSLADEASDHSDKATRFYNVQDWPNALKEYKEAYGLDPKPETLWAIAQTQRLSGDCRGAILTYKAYMRGASTTGANAAEGWIQQCEATIAAQQKALDDATKSEPAKPAPAITAPPAPPAPAAKPAAPAPARAHRSAALDPLGDTLAGIALVGLVGGGAYLYSGNTDMTAAAKKPTYQLYDRAVDAARDEQHLGTYAMIGGAVFAGLAVWRFAAVASHHDDEHVQAALLPGGGLVAYTGRF